MQPQIKCWHDLRGVAEIYKLVGVRVFAVELLASPSGGVSRRSQKRMFSQALTIGMFARACTCAQLNLHTWCNLVKNVRGESKIKLEPLLRHAQKSL